MNNAWQFIDYTYTAYNGGSGGTPNLTIVKSHTGSFTQGQTGAAYTITVTNNGTGPTSGTTTVSDTLPSGLTASGISGSGWTCTVSPLSCSRSDALAAGYSYPAITLTVNVAANAPASVTNTATISGGGSTTDVTTINSSGGSCGSGATATMSTPVPGSTVSGSSVTLTWCGVAAAQEYYLYEGTTGAGSYDLGYQNEYLATSQLVSNIPASGTLYVRLWTLSSNGWLYNDYSYPIGSGGAVAITVASSPAGLSLTVDGTAYTTPHTFQWTAGQSHTIGAATQAGGTGVQYAFANWSDLGAASHPITVPSLTATYTASFTTQYYLTTAAAAGGTISPTSGWFNYNTIVSVSAAANAGYQFSGFAGALTGITTPQNLTMGAPATVTANFAATVAITVTSTPTGLSLTVDGTACTTPYTYQWTPGQSHTIGATTQAGGTGVQYSFANWSDLGAASHSITAPASPATYTANFATQYYLTTGVNPAGEGSISPANGWVTANTQVSVTATANSGYQFSNFIPALTGTNSSGSLTMTAPATVTAYFTTAQGAGAAPGQPFADVPTNSPYFDATSTFDQLLITQGCDPTPDFCPTTTLLRQEMAAFIVRSWSVRMWNDPEYFNNPAKSPVLPSPTPYFSDVPSTSPYFPYIQKLYELGITGGTAAPTFDGNGNVLTPGQFAHMNTLANQDTAVFIVRARALSDNGCTMQYLDPTLLRPFQKSPNSFCVPDHFTPTQAPYFTDVPSSYSYYPWIQRLGDLGALGTVGPNCCTFNPTNTINRGPMAVETVIGVGLDPRTSLSINLGPNTYSTPPSVTVPFYYTHQDEASGANPFGASDINYAQFYLLDSNGGAHCMGDWGRPSTPPGSPILSLYSPGDPLTTTSNFGSALSDSFCTVSLVSIANSPTDATAVNVQLNFAFDPAFAGTYTVMSQVNYIYGSYQSSWENVGSLTLQDPFSLPDPVAASVPDYLVPSTPPTPSCNISGDWHDSNGTASDSTGGTWSLTQPDNTVTGTYTYATTECGSTTWSVSGIYSSNAATLDATNPNPPSPCGVPAGTVHAVITFSSCSLGQIASTVSTPSYTNSQFQQVPAQQNTFNGTFTLVGTPTTFSVSPTPMLPLSTGDQNVKITTTSSRAGIPMKPVYLTGNMLNPSSDCGVKVTIPDGSGTGSASSIVSASPAGCSGIFDAYAVVGGSVGTPTNNMTKIVVPPQVLPQVMWGEAHGQAATYGVNDPSEQAVGVTIRNRFGDSVYFKNRTTYQNTITTDQFDGINTSLTTGSDANGQPIAELLNAAAVFGGSSTVSVANAKCFFSPTAAGWAQIQAALSSGTTTVPPGISHDPKCFGPNKQLVVKTSISKNTDGSGAPAFVFEQWRALGDPAVIQIP